VCYCSSRSPVLSHDMTDAASRPTIAVIVPTRDRPEMLRRALDAILSQAYPGVVRVLVVFDQTEPDDALASDDPLRTVRVLRNTRVAGLPGARNSGIAACGADAEFVAFCDDDDIWLPGKLAAQVDHLVQAPDVGLCTTGILIDFDGNLSSRPSPVTELSVDRLLRDRTTEAHPSTFLFRRTALDAVGLVDEQIPGGYSEDYDFLLRVAKFGRISCLRQPLVRVRWGRTSYFAARWQTIVDAQRYLLAKHPEFESDRRAVARIRGQISFALAALGERRLAVREIGRVIRYWPLEKRWAVAGLVALKLLSADRALAIAHRAGRGI
jgi:glycosyltransferase involved in cell wall biosynthesis